MLGLRSGGRSYVHQGVTNRVGPLSPYAKHYYDEWNVIGRGTALFNMTGDYKSMTFGVIDS